MQQQIDIGDIALNAAIEDGAAGAPWITFSNSHATDLTLWDEQVELLKSRFRILRYDTRGHGKSGATPGNYDFDLLTSDVLRLWDKLGIEKSSLVGLSLGGTTALELAARASDRVTAVVACDCRHNVTPEFSASWNPRIQLARKEGTEPLAAPTLARWFTEGFQDRNPAGYAKVHRMICETSPDGYIGCAEALKIIDVEKRLGDIRCPVKIITGRLDPAAGPDYIAGMAVQINAATTAIIENAAHITNIEQPAAFNAELEEFLSGP